MNPLVPIPLEAIPTMIHKIVHVQGWPHGCQFRLEGILDDEALLVTPKTNRKYRVPRSKLCYSRAHEPKELAP